MEFFWLLNFSVVIILLPFHTCFNSNHTEVHVGVILDLNSSKSPVGPIGLSCLYKAHSDFYSLHSDYRTRLILHVRNSNDSVVDAAAAALNLLQDVKVDAIIGPQRSTQANFVMDLGNRSHVPIISFSATSPSLIPQTPYFVRTAESDANQVQAIASIVEAYRWSQVVIVYEETDFGNGIMPYLSNALQDVNVRVSYRSVFPLLATDDFICEELYKMKTMQTRVFIVHMSQFLGTRFFVRAKDLGMMSDGYAWIVTSGMMDLFGLMDSGAVDAMQGVLGVGPLIPNSKQLQRFYAKCLRDFLLSHEDMKLPDTSIFCLWAYDTLWALAMAVERVENSEANTMKCNEDVDFVGGFDLMVSDKGPKILDALLETKFIGLAGEFRIVHGELNQKPYQIVNIFGETKRTVGTWTPVCGISGAIIMSETNCLYFSNENLKAVIWPGGSTIAPRGFEIPVDGKKLRIGVPKKPGFNEFLKVETDPQTNSTQVSGYFQQIFESVMGELPYAITYEYVAYPFLNPNGSRAGCYNDLMYQVSSQDHYDAAIGDITITANRSTYVDFTLPFAEGGIAGIVSIEYEDANSVWTFLEPLTKQLWLTIAAFYISTALAIWILGYRIAKGSREAAGQHAGMMCYFPFFPGQGINVSLLCVVVVTWAFVASLLNSTYTASLSSRLTVQTLRPTVTDVTQLIKDGDFVGTQDGSFLVDFLIKLGFDASKIKTFQSTEDCHEALTKGSTNGGISAYYDVLPHIKMFMFQYCGKYKMFGPISRTAGFAFAFPKGSPVVADISRTIIRLTEKGTIQEIEQRFPSNAECSAPDGNSTGTHVTLRSFVVLFSFTGCVTLICLVVSLLVYLHHQRPFPGRFSDVKANVSSRIDALKRYLKQTKSWAHSKIVKHTGNQVPRN